MKEFDLNKEPKITSGFKAPDRYFEDFSAKILEQLHENESKVIPISSRNKSWMYAVAAVLVVALTIPLYHILNTPTAAIDKATLENYITGHTNLSEEDFAELLDEKDIEQIKIDSHIEDKAIEDLLSANSNLETYLIN
jgi:hypothetical protein